MTSKAHLEFLRDHGFVTLTASHGGGAVYIEADQIVSIEGHVGLHTMVRTVSGPVFCAESPEDVIGAMAVAAGYRIEENPS